MARSKLVGRNMQPQAKAKGVKINEDVVSFTAKENEVPTSV